MKNIIKKTIAVILVVITLFSALSVGASAAVSKSYYKTGTTYTVNGNKYREATLVKDYKGVKKGHEFYIDKNNRPVTSNSIIGKLNFTRTVSECRTLFLDTAKSKKSATIAIVNTASKFSGNNMITGVLGSGGVALIKCVAGNPLGAMVDTANLVMDPELVATAVCIGVMKRYGQSAVDYGNKAINALSKNITDYNKALTAYKYYCNLMGFSAAACKIGRPIVDEAASIKNATAYTFKQLAKGVCNDVIGSKVQKLYNVVKMEKSVRELTSILGTESAKNSAYNPHYAVAQRYISLSGTNSSAKKLAS